MFYFYTQMKRKETIKMSYCDSVFFGKTTHVDFLKSLEGID